MCKWVEWIEELERIAIVRPIKGLEMITTIGYDKSYIIRFKRATAIRIDPPGIKFDEWRNGKADNWFSS